MKYCRVMFFVCCLGWHGSVHAEHTLNMYVREAPVRSVLEGVARSSHINLLIDDTVQGTVTLTLNNVTAEEALDAIAASQNLYYEKNGPVRTITAGKKQNGIKEVRTWHLRHAAPKDVQEAVRAVMADSDVRCYEDTNTLVVGGTPQEHRAVQTLIETLDAKPRQVEVEVEIASIDRSALRHAGIEWNWSDVSGGSGREGFSFAAQIQALEEKGKAEVLARPHMMAINGKEASVLIGDKIPVVTEHVSNGEKTATTEYKDVGVKLRYVPRIHDDNTVTASIEAEVSLPVFVNEMKAYRIATRQAKTVVRMLPGKTLVLGGLIRKEDVESLRKVPILGDIPLLGKLFRSKYTSSKETEVVILMRSTVRS